MDILSGLLQARVFFRPSIGLSLSFLAVVKKTFSFPFHLDCLRIVDSVKQISIESLGRPRAPSRPISLR
jgi:hypothetical protein